MEHSVAEWAYLAGIIDGEGSLSMVRRDAGFWRENFTITLQVGNCDRELIEWLHRFGGVVSLDRPAKKPNHRPHSHWTASSSHARAVLPTVTPFLIIKKQRAEWALRVLDIQEQNRYKRYDIAVKEEMQALRKLFENDPRKARTAIPANRIYP